MSTTKNGSKNKLDLVGTAEAADILGVERPRIGRWLKKGVMPRPVAELAATPVWLRSDVEEMRPYVESRRRGRGAEEAERVTCACAPGCTADPGVYPKSDARRGQVKGEPRKYAPGHNPVGGTTPREPVAA